MHGRTAANVCVLGTCALLSVLFLSLSVAEGSTLARTSTGKTEQAPAKHPAVPSGNKHKRASGATPYLAALTEKPAPARESLLAVVAQSGLTDHHKRLADTVLKSLPAQCRNNLKNFHVLYKDAKQRGLGGKTTIILDGSVPDTEFIGLLIHECGHVTHGNMLGSIESGESVFHDGSDVFALDSAIPSFFGINWTAERVMKAGSKKEDFVSGYAQSDAFEDFAETFAAYVLHRDMLELRAQSNASIATKLAWMETHLPLAKNTLGVSDYAWNKKVPWDVTKLSWRLR